MTVENVPCGAGAVTCTKSARIQLYGTTIHLVRGSDPVITEDPSYETEAEYTIDIAGLYLFVKTPYGMLALQKNPMGLWDDYNYHFGDP